MSQPEMKRRVAAAQKTLDRFKDKKFRFGRYDCAQMVRSHLVAMGKPVKQAAKAGTYHSKKGGEAALKRLGYGSLADMMDAHFEQIPPAAARPGDVIELPGEAGPGALTIALGNGRVIGYHQDAAGAVVLQPREYERAWRVPIGPHNS